MNGYIAFYRGKRKELQAETLYKAKLAALKHFEVSPMANKASEVHVELAEVDGKQVTTTITN
jgi:hypothetical protein